MMFQGPVNYQQRGARPSLHVIYAVGWLDKPERFGVELRNPRGASQYSRPAYQLEISLSTFAHVLRVLATEDGLPVPTTIAGAWARPVLPFVMPQDRRPLPEPETRPEGGKQVPVARKGISLHTIRWKVRRREVPITQYSASFSVHRGGTWQCVQFWDEANRAFQLMLDHTSLPWFINAAVTGRAPGAEALRAQYNASLQVEADQLRARAELLAPL